MVIVVASYKATGPEQLSLEKGQLIQVKKKNSSGWWEGETQVKGKKKEVGWFPATYVKPLNAPAAADSSSTNRSAADAGVAAASSDQPGESSCHLDASFIRRKKANRLHLDCRRECDLDLPVQGAA